MAARTGKLNADARSSALRGTLLRIRPYRAYVALCLIVAAASVAAQLYIPILTGDAIDEMIGAGCVNFAGVARIVVNIALSIGVAAL